MDAPTFSCQVDGKPYAVDYRKLTGRELMDFQTAVGVPFQAAASGAVEPLVFVAGVKWLSDRRTDPKASFGSILDSITYEQVTFGEQEPEADPPTQEAGSKPASPPSPVSTESSLGSSSTSPSKSLTST